MIVTVMAEAPVVILRISGLASTLRVTVGVSAPESPKVLPTAMAVATQGMRQSRTTSFSTWVSSPRGRNLQHSGNGERVITQSNRERTQENDKGRGNEAYKQHSWAPYEGDRPAPQRRTIWPPLGSS